MIKMNLEEYIHISNTEKAKSASAKTGISKAVLMFYNFYINIFSYWVYVR